MTGRYRLATPLIAMCLSACVSTATQVTTSYYNVRGETAEEIDADIRRNGPMRGHALAVAAISLQPVSVQQSISGNSCSFSTAKFRVNAAITLPRWTDRLRSRDNDLRRAWRGLSDYARWHEDTHVKIAEEFAKQLGDDIEAIPPQRNCERLDRIAERIVKKNAKAHDRAQNAFDAREQERLRRMIATN
ncbi:MAG: DUF922 domain-containing protein [Pseudomonadota bacterium]